MNKKKIDWKYEMVHVKSTETTDCRLLWTN